MEYRKLNEWDVSPKEALAIQMELRSLVEVEDRLSEVKIVGGIDVGIVGSMEMATGGVVAYSFPELELIETAAATIPVTFPYIQGLLAFRECPAVLAAVDLLECRPDIFIVSGHGLAHPRRFGIACHLGLIFERPTIGIGKSPLTGQFNEPGPHIGDPSPLYDDDERIGTVLRTKEHTSPLFVSPGHMIGFESACRVTLDCIRDHKLPEPLRTAHSLVSRYISHQV